MSLETVNTTAPTVGAEAVQPVQQAVVPQTATHNTAQAEKSARFITRAENQDSKAMAEIEKLQKLSNKKYYTYTPQQINELFGAIQSSLDEAKASFTSDSPEKKKLFTFSV